MAMDYSVYQSLYTYMNSVLGQLQSLSAQSQTIGSLYSGKTQDSSLSFGETYLSTC